MDTHEEQDGNGTANKASVTTSSQGHNKAIITVHPRLHELIEADDLGDLENAIVHELVHIVMDDFVTMVEHCIGFLSPENQEALKPVILYQEEKLTEILANILISLRSTEISGERANEMIARLEGRR